MVGIIISSLAHDFTVMLVGRTIQGIGGGGIILLNDVIITDLVPMRLRGAYFGAIGGVWALGSVSGPVIGGALAYRASWVSSPIDLLVLGTALYLELMNHTITYFSLAPYRSSFANRRCSLTLEMDFLDQSSICSDWTDHGSYFHETGTGPKYNDAQTQTG